MFSGILDADTNNWHRASCSIPLKLKNVKKIDSVPEHDKKDVRLRTSGIVYMKMTSTIVSPRLIESIFFTLFDVQWNTATDF